MVSSSQHQWTIQPLSGYTTEITFHILNIFYSQRCEIISLGLLKKADCQHEELYCGYLPPWNESCFCQSISVTLASSSPTTRAEFILSYQISKKNHLMFFLNIHLIAMEMTIYSSSWYNISTYIPQKVIMFIYSEHGSLIQLAAEQFESGKFQKVRASQLRLSYFICRGICFFSNFTISSILLSSFKFHVSSISCISSRKVPKLALFHK